MKSIIKPLCQWELYISDPSGTRRTTGLTMFIVRVILGRSYIHTKEEPLADIPCQKRGCMKPGCEEHDPFDSVVAGINKRFREFLVFDTKRCFPQYLVVYDRE